MIEDRAPPRTFISLFAEIPVMNPPKTPPAAASPERDASQCSQLPPADAELPAAKLHLVLSRTRILGNLGRTTHPSHRAMLERALEDIEKRLSSA